MSGDASGEDLHSHIRRGIDVYRSHGVVELSQRATGKLVAALSETVVERPKDRLVRRFLGDPYTLPTHIRRKPDYMHTRRYGQMILDLIHHHTDVDFKTASAVADVGCGDGCVAREFIRDYPSLDYQGLDIDRAKIDSLRSRYRETPYDFYHADIYNESYRPTGTIEAASYTFPFGDNSMEFVWSNALFPHLQPSEAKNYLAEIRRVLEPSGQAWISVPILAEDRGDMERDKRFEVLNFTNKIIEGEYTYYTPYPEHPTHSLGFAEDTFDRLLEETDMQAADKILGHWRDESLARDTHRHRIDALVVEPT
jgi:SAM-dependent methyltransferase